MRALFILCLMLWLAGAYAAPAAAQNDAAPQGIRLRHAELGLQGDSYRLTTDFEVRLSNTLEDALHKGVPLSFVLEFDLVQPRWYWFDGEVAHVVLTYVLRYSALTRQYELDGAGAHRSYDSLADALAELGRLRNLPVAERGALAADLSYQASLRMSLDTNALPKPLQINAIASKHKWDLNADWHYWSVFPKP